MNFYQHHIGDFNNATRHLSRIERSIYRDLLELYYDTESPLTSDFDRLARRCIVEDDDQAAMRDVLNEFFILLDDGYHNTRADKEISAYKRMAEGGKRGAEKRWEKGYDSRPIAPPLTPHAKANANHEPITMNHEPLTNNHEPDKSIGATASRLPSKAKRKHSLPEDFEPKRSHYELADSLSVILFDELPQFCDYHVAKGSTMTNWDLALNTWLRNAKKFRKSEKQQTQFLTPHQQREENNRKSTAAFLADDSDPFTINGECSHA